MAGELREILGTTRAAPGIGPAEAEKSMGVVEAAKEGLNLAGAAYAPGLSLSAILADVGAEMGRLGVQGSAELASALFGNNSYVPYGRGQNPLDKGKEGEHDQEAQKPEQQPERSQGRSM